MEGRKNWLARTKNLDLGSTWQTTGASSNPATTIHNYNICVGEFSAFHWFFPVPTAFRKLLSFIVAYIYHIDTMFPSH